MTRMRSEVRLRSRCTYLCEKEESEDRRLPVRDKKNGEQDFSRRSERSDADGVVAYVHRADVADRR